MCSRDDATVARRRELAAAAPIRPRTAWVRDGERVYLCGTLGADFDAWHRTVSAVSAADAMFAQEIGLEAVERAMDGLEEQVRAGLRPGERLGRRKSPGYGDMPLSLSREILDRLDAGRRLGVFLTPSLLLVPSKTVTAICLVSHEE